MLSEETVLELAKTAQIALDEQETGSLTNELNLILEDISSLKKIASLDIEPMVRPLNYTNITRADEAKNVLSQAEALQNAPEEEANMFRVSSILGGEM